MGKMFFPSIFCLFIEYLLPDTLYYRYKAIDESPISRILIFVTVFSIPEKVIKDDDSDPYKPMPDPNINQEETGK